ncbi:hypothetical protein DTO271D3_8413 [Paecilomyces variotii]|nr:hypothetical protein DTO271D3_8413 [Paecilomyces variotii]
MITCCFGSLLKPRRQIDLDKKKLRERHLQNALVSLPSTRQRSLSIPLIKEPLIPGNNKIKKNKKKQSTSNKFQSSFFSKLPAEIRRKIYIEVLGGQVLNIFKDETARYVKWIPQRKPLLALPMSCRRIYSETIDLLYSHNTFFFNDFDTILWFVSTILPQRLAAIRTLHVEWDCVCFWHARMRPPPPYDRDTWMRVWRTIPSMTGLRELMVRIWNGPRMDAATEMDVFRPLTALKGLERFELELPWRYQGVGGEEEEEGNRDMPFKIRRVRREYDMTNLE